MFGENTIMWMGVVEDRSDPIKLGRVRVRIFGWYSENVNEVPVTDLPWAQVIQSPTNAAVGDIGQSPTGLVEGSWVVGFFLDGKQAQKPIVLGSLSGIPDKLASEYAANAGFKDPNRVYPSRKEEPDVNRLSRADADFVHSNPATKNRNRTTSVATASGGSWDEPASGYAAEYPYNHVYESESGHISEVDDTEGSERLHQYHKSGTFEEIVADGTRVVRVVGTDYEILLNGKNVYVNGACNITVNGAATVKAGAVTLSTDDVNWSVNGDFTVNTTGNINLNSS